MATVKLPPWSRNPKIVDLMDYEMFARGIPHDKFKILRDEYPVYWNEEEGDEPGFWAITKHQDVCDVSLDTETFSSAKGINIYYDAVMDPAIVGALVGNMICLDPPLHTSYRKIPQPFFTLAAVQEREARVREITNQILDEAAEKNDCDFMADIAARLPILILCDILGVPQSDMRLIFEWSNQLTGWEDPELNPSPQAGIATYMELFQYGQRIVQDRRENPTDDLMSAMANAKPEGVEIPDVLMDGFFILMVIAGNETTRNTISGGMQALLQHPDQYRKLVENPGLLDTAVDEILRWISPVMYMRRTATRDTEIRGVSIAEGDKVVMWYGSANRDEDVFENADTFDITRDPNPHIAFGHGRHRCLGSLLAQLQLRVIFAELMRRFPNIELTGDVRRVHTNFINGIKAMPVRLNP